MQHHNNPRTLAPILLAALSCALLLGCTPGASDDGGEGGSGGGGGEAGAGEGGEGGSTDQAGQSGGGQGGQPTGGKGGVGGASVTTVEYGIETRPKNSTCVAPAKAEPGNPDFPKTIRDTGCFRSDDPKVPVEGVIAYDLQAPLWSDAAEKQRWLAVPDGKSITVKEDGDFDFPVGSVLIKTFAFEGKTLETRFMFRHADGAWAGYTYVWDTEGKDAVLAGPAASFRFVGNIEWTFPSRDNCLGCHQEASGRTLGPEIAQLNAAFVYPGNRKANQLRTLDHLGLFSKPLGDPSKLKALPKPSDEAASVDARLRAYMHSNCSHCHRPNGVPEVVMDLRFDTPLKGTNLCNVPPAKGSYGVPDARIVTPGNVDLSTIALRVRSLAQNVRMPSLGSVVVDEDGAALLEDWIASLKSCP